MEERMRFVAGFLDGEKMARGRNRTTDAWILGPTRGRPTLWKESYTPAKKKKREISLKLLKNKNIDWK